MSKSSLVSVTSKPQGPMLTSFPLVFGLVLQTDPICFLKFPETPLVSRAPRSPISDQAVDDLDMKCPPKGYPLGWQQKWVSST